MKIEWLIGFYMLVCVSMTVFNFGFLVNENVQAKRLEKKRRRISAQLNNLVKSGETTAAHLKSLERSLKFLSGLESFDLALESFREESPRECQRYLSDIAPILERLSHWHSTKSDLRFAFFSFVVGKWYVKRPADPRLLETLHAAIRTRPFYARQNALMAIATIGTARSLADAIVDIGRVKTFHHPKLLTEALLAFPGNRAELAQELTARFSEFRPDVQAAIINFGRMADIVYLDEEDHDGRRRRLKALMTNPETDAEVRLACIRFFTRDPWNDVAGDLRDFAIHDGAESWEYAAVAASALAKYPGTRTVTVLKACLSSRIWHVRHNAARSLRALGVGMEELQDVLDAGDRFARDTILYHWKEED